MSEIEEAPVSAVSGSTSKTPVTSPIRPMLKKYEVGKLVGCGSFAEVYHAREVENGQSVAIKVINKEKLTGEVTSNNIKREMLIMQRLCHPNIIRLKELLASRTKIYIVMEFARDGDLSRRMSKGRFTEDLSRKCFQQLICAVGYCHLNGVYHRDLKPENILIDENFDLKVSDFGLSATIDQVREDGLLHTICGTPAYVAPEILRHKGYDGAKADIWSCGVILYSMTAGSLPFYDPNLLVMYRKMQQGKYRCPEWMSRELRRLLSRLLDTNPRTRITIDEIKRDPWFKKGFKEKVFDEDNTSSDKDDKIILGSGPLSLNAFDLISFSPGLDLSGLLDESCGSLENSVHLAVEQSSPKMIMERVTNVAKEVENARLNRKKDWVVELQGHRAGAKFIIWFEVFRLTDTLLVVEAKRRAGPASFFHVLWEIKFRPAILGKAFTG